MIGRGLKDKFKYEQYTTTYSVRIFSSVLFSKFCLDGENCFEVCKSTNMSFCKVVALIVEWTGTAQCVLSGQADLNPKFP